MLTYYVEGLGDLRRDEPYDNAAGRDISGQGLFQLDLHRAARVGATSASCVAPTQGGAKPTIVVS